MRTIAITNRKGGSGKTTAAVNLAAVLGEAGKRVLIVDLDPQASTSHWLGVNDEGHSLLDTLKTKGNIVDIAEETGFAGVDVVPASEWLVEIESGMGEEPIPRKALRDCLKKSRRASWDFVLIDCPPSLGILSVLALAAAKEILVPVETSALALEGIPALMRTVETVAKNLNRGLRVNHLLPCRVDSRKILHRDVIENLRKNFGELVFNTSIRENVRLQEAPSHCEPITTFAPKSTGAKDFRAAAQELMKRRGN